MDFDNPPPRSDSGPRGRRRMDEERGLVRNNQPAAARGAERGRLRWRGRPRTLGGADRGRVGPIFQIWNIDRRAAADVEANEGH